MSEEATQVQQNCIFCSIALGKVPSKKVYEDERVIAVLDINPANPGHVLLLPKQHYALMMQMPDDLVGHMFFIARNISSALLTAFDLEGTNIFIANGAAAGQKAPHFMLHIIPRIEGDGLVFSAPYTQIDGNNLALLRAQLIPLIKDKLGLSDEQVASFYQPSHQTSIPQQQQVPVQNPQQPQPSQPSQPSQPPLAQQVPQPNTQPNNIQNNVQAPVQQPPQAQVPVQPDQASSKDDGEKKKDDDLDLVSGMFK